MTTTTMGSTATAPLNLAALVAPLPPVILPNGTSHALVFTADAAERYKGIRRLIAAVERGDTVDDLAAEDDIDECLAVMIPTATNEDLASFGARVEVKLTVLAAAAGRLDAVMHALHTLSQSGKAAEAGEAPPSSPSTTSAP
jgi:hypothetical protein